MPLRTYRTALSRPGALRFVVAGFVAQLPLSMQTLGCLLLVAAVTHSYASAGAVAAAFDAASAAGAQVLGRLADRYGQRRVIIGSLIGHIGGFIALIALVSARAPTWTYFLGAVVAGTMSLPFGSLVRSRWAALLGDGDEIQAAYALEATLDDVVYIIGPPVVVLLAARAGASAGLWCTLVLVCAGGLALAAQRGTEPAHGPPASAADGRLLRIGGIWVITAVYLAFGMYVGALEPAMITFAGRHGAPGFGGVLLSLMTVGSMAAGIVFGMRTWRLPRARLLLAVTTALCASAVPLLFAGSIPVMIGCAMLCGLGISPLLITGSGLLVSIAPRAVLTAGFAFTGSATVLGAAAGTAIGGDLIEQQGPRWAFAFAVAAAGTAVLASVIGQRHLSGTPSPPEAGRRRQGASFSGN